VSIWDSYMVVGNMKEIKFRAWDKNFKQWVLGELTTFGLVTHLDLKPGDINMASRVPTIPAPTHYDLNDWMQYTGLKDKNGKDVYEGDILAFDAHVDGIKKFYQETTFSDGCFNLSQSDSSLGEVVGNVWENPELLTHESN